MLSRKNLPKWAIEVYLFVPDYPGATDQIKLKTEKIFSGSGRTKYRLMMKTGWCINRKRKKIFITYLDSIKPDIIHTHTEFALGKIGQ